MSTTTRSILAGLAACSCLLGGTAGSAEAASAPAPQMAPAPLWCGLPSWAPGYGAFCTPWKAYASAFLDVQSTQFRQPAVSDLMAVAGNTYLADVAGSVSLSAGACGTEVETDTLVMLNGWYARGHWASLLDKVLLSHGGGWAGKIYWPTVKYVAAAAVRVGDYLYLKQTAQFALTGLASDGCLS